MAVPRRIVHYDFADLYYSSFFVSGFLANAGALKYRFEFSKELPPELAFVFENPMFLRRYLLFQAQLDAETFYFCIDTEDPTGVVSSGDRGRLGLLDVTKYCFKVNYSRRRVDSDPALAPHASKILPAAPFFPVATAAMRCRVPRLTPYPPALWTHRDVLDRVKASVNTPTPRQLLALRARPKTHDVFFVSSYYSGDRAAATMDFRYEIMRALRAESGIHSICGFARDGLPRRYADLEVPKLPFARYLRHLAAARVGVYVRGLHECVSFKFSELLALGLPIVGQRLANDVDAVLRNGRLMDQLSFETPGEIVARIGELLERPEERAELAAENRSLFDSYLNPKAVTARLLLELGFSD